MNSSERIVLVFPRTSRHKQARREGVRVDALTVGDLKLLWEAEQTINRLSGVRLHILTESVEQEGSDD